MKTAMLWRSYKLLLLGALLLSAPCWVSGQLNYSFTPIYGTFDTITGATMIMPDSTDEALSAPINIGFPFSFACNAYTQFMVSSNGWMSLGAAATGPMPVNNLATTGQGPILAPLWDDLAVSGDSMGNISYAITGTAPNRVMTVQWLYMKWGAPSPGPVMSFQVKLYETTNIIEFVYQREAFTIWYGSASIGISGGTIPTDFYSINGLPASPVAIYGIENDTVHTRPRGGQVFRWTPPAMVYDSAVTTQAGVGTVPACTLNKPIIGVQITTDWCDNATLLTQLYMSMAGSTIPGTSTSDVTAIHIYYTGSSPVFAPINEFVPGGITPAPGTIIANGSQALVQGINYFWIAYDLNAATATVGDALDARCTGLRVGGFAKTPVVTNPAGKCIITKCGAAPGGVGGMAFWIEGTAGTSATVDGTPLSGWNDQSGNSRNAVSPTVSNSPRYNDNSTDNINFNPQVYFDDASQNAAIASFMDIPGNGILAAGDNAYEVYALVKPGPDNLVTPGKFLFAGTAGLNNFNAFGVQGTNALGDIWDMNDLTANNTWTINYPALATFDYNAIQRQLFVSGASAGTLAGNGRNSADINDALGCQRAALAEFYNGGIAEIVTYPNTSHTVALRNRVESYLGIKYGVTLQHNYVSSAAATVWNLAQDPAYNTNIIGIARDDNSALLQKQSKSTSTAADLLTLYIGPSKMVNQFNNGGTFTAGDQSFFMAADNNAKFLFSVPSMTAEKPPGICCRLQREWLSQKNNFTNTDLTLEFDFNVVTPGYAPLNPADLRLLVDDDGDFTNALILAPPAITISVAASVVTVVVPASNFTATPYFTLASVSLATTLPVEVSDFAAACRNNTVQLQWTKRSGAANSFIVERSADGKAFSGIGTLQAEANGPQTFGFTDPMPPAGLSYYRLKITDQGGATTYTAAISMNSCNPGKLLLVTDQATGRHTLFMQLQQNASIDIGLSDVLGRRLDMPGFTGPRTLPPGVYQLPVPDHAVAAGIYFLSVTINGNSNVLRMLQR